MFDFHTHILPQIDDGSRSVEESLAMLRALSAQGVSGVAATPHFYADEMAPEKFFARREAAWEKLSPYLSAQMPEVRLGAEVMYYDGIQHMSDVHHFCLSGTRLLLVEMPTVPWTSRMVNALLTLNGSAGITVLLAHVERYWSFVGEDTWNALRKNGVLMQVSADVFLPWRARRTALRLLREGDLHLIGSDCHNMTSRRPHMGEAIACITKKGGTELLYSIYRKEEHFLHEKRSPDLKSGRIRSV